MMNRICIVGTGSVGTFLSYHFVKEMRHFDVITISRSGSSCNSSNFRQLSFQPYNNASLCEKFSLSIQELSQCTSDDMYIICTKAFQVKAFCEQLRSFSRDKAVKPIIVVTCVSVYALVG